MYFYKSLIEVHKKFTLQRRPEKLTPKKYKEMPIKSEFVIEKKYVTKMDGFLNRVQMSLLS